MILRLLGLLMLMPSLAACGTFDLLGSDAQEASQLVVGQPATVEGEVIEIISDCAFDGTCAYILDTDEGQYTVIWADGMTCVNFDAEVDNAAVGDTVRAYAMVESTDTLSICPAGAWTVKKVN